MHYSLLVISRDGDYESVLEKYDENIDVEPYVAYTPEQAVEDEREWLSEDGINLQAAHKTASKNAAIMQHYLGRHPEISVDIERKVSNGDGDTFDFTDWELYCLKAYGYASEDMIDENGNLISTYNPDSKWDWYEVGGRWSGLLPLKNGGFANEATVGEVDFSLDKEEYEKSLTVWNAVVNNKPLPAGLDWGSLGFFSRPNKDYFLERYGNATDYAESQAVFTTHDVITADGVWHGRDDDSVSWDISYAKKFLVGLDPDMRLTIIDRHI